MKKSTKSKTKKTNPAAIPANGLHVAYERNGKIKSEKRYLEGRLESEKHYLDGKLHGVYRRYFHDGEPWYEEHYRHGECYLQRDYDDGKLERESHYKDHALHGVERRYHDNGTLKVETTYQNDCIIGVQKRYHDNGILQAEIPYERGWPSGVARFYDREGELSHEVCYEGKIKREFYDNGVLMSERPYGEEGRLHGVEREYHENGNLRAECPHYHGSRHGIERCYYPDGTLEYEAERMGDNRHGMSRWYDEAGRLKMEEEYRDGYLYRAKTYREGTLVDERIEEVRGRSSTGSPNVERPRSDGTTYDYYEDGTLSMEIDPKRHDGAKMRRIYSREGELLEERDLSQKAFGYEASHVFWGLEWYVYRNYDEEGGLRIERIRGDRMEDYFARKFCARDGKPYSEQVYSEEMGGCERRYFANGNIWYERLYDMRRRKQRKSGKCYLVSYYYPNGELESTTQYDDEQPHGVHRRYYPDGTLKLQMRYRHGKPVSGVKKGSEKPEGEKKEG